MVDYSSANEFPNTQLLFIDLSGGFTIQRLNNLRASSPVGVYCEKYTCEQHTRGDATTARGRRKKSLQ